jgi:hypothetical protein
MLAAGTRPDGRNGGAEEGGEGAEGGDEGKACAGAFEDGKRGAVEARRWRACGGNGGGFLLAGAWGFGGCPPEGGGREALGRTSSASNSGAWNTGMGTICAPSSSDPGGGGGGVGGGEYATRPLGVGRRCSSSAEMTGSAEEGRPGGPGGIPPA